MHLLRVHRSLYLNKPHLIIDTNSTHTHHTTTASNNNQATENMKIGKRKYEKEKEKQKRGAGFTNAHKFFYFLLFFFVVVFSTHLSTCWRQHDHCIKN